MKLSSKVIYSVQFMIDLAIHGAGGPVFMKDVARRQGISEKYLGHFVPLLKNAGLIVTHRGAHGGFLLAKPGETISLCDIIEAVDGPISLIESEGEGEDEDCRLDFWCEAAVKVRSIFDSYSLAELSRRHLARYEDITYVI